jgi:hypothetical protein
MVSDNNNDNKNAPANDKMKATDLHSPADDASMPLSPDRGPDSSFPSSARQKSWLKVILADFWDAIIIRQVFHKIITLFFALAVFGFAYMHMAPHRSVLTYMGVMLLMVLVYVEILVIRDHLWVIEGSMRESRRWRDIFFNQTNLRRQRIRKFLIMLFSLGIFSYVYIKSAGKSNHVLSFMGLILMITARYYEILRIRDEVLVMMHAIYDGNPPLSTERKGGYEKFINPAADPGKMPSEVSADTESLPHTLPQSDEKSNEP